MSKNVFGFIFSNKREIGIYSVVKSVREQKIWQNITLFKHEMEKMHIYLHTKNGDSPPPFLRCHHHKTEQKIRAIIIASSCSHHALRRSSLKNSTNFKNNFAEIASSAMQEIHKIFTKIIEYFFFSNKFLDSWWGH